MNSTLAALALLNGLLANASQISQLIEKAQSEGRSTFTDAEWSVITGSDDAARKMLADEIAKAKPSTIANQAG
jgi:3'-phosphoadenosine 5'-phosphosulfate (PAPS) 3'-phosphatase